MMGEAPSTETYSRWAIAASVTAAGASIAVLAALLALAQPMGDDFCYGVADPGGLWARIARNYFTHSGRWASIATHQLVTGSIDLVRGYAASLALLFALRGLASYVLARSALHEETPRKICALAAGGFTLLYWCAMPATGDSLFWLQGALELELCGVALLLAAAILLRTSLNAWRGFVIAILAVLIPGHHELAGLALCMVLAGGCGLAFRRGSGDRWIRVALLMVSVAGLLVVAAAPGNYVRAERQGTTWSIPWALATTAVNLSAWLPRWMLDAPLLLCAALLVMDPRIRLRDEWNRADVRLWFLMGWLGVMVSQFFAMSLATGGLLPGRVLNWFYFLFVTGLFGNVLLWKSRWPAFKAPGPLRSALLVATFASMFFAGNAWLGAVDLALRAPGWHSARLAALQMIRASGPGTAATLPALPATPQMYFDYDAATDPSEYPNRCMARYFGVGTVVSPNPARGPRGAALSGRTYGLLDRP